MFLLFLLLLLPCNTFALNSQAAALLSWKISLGGANLLSNWTETTPNPCQWIGISCNNKGSVLGLNLQYINLNGGLPNNLTLTALAPSITSLVLSGTNLTGPIPPEIGNLRQLIHLDLSDNAISGEIPAFLPGSRIQKLLLNSNRLEGTIPDSIADLTELRWLVVYDNQLAGNITASIGRLGNLEVFRAGGNKNLVGALPVEIGNCRNLVILGVAETSISGALPASLGLLLKLQTLAIYTALLSGPIPPELGQCEQLENVYLYENSITGSIPVEIGQLKKLKNLLLWQNNLVGVIPPELLLCIGLEVLDLSMNGLTGPIPDTIGNLTRLKELQLSVNQISSSIPRTISNCRNLTDLELDNNQISGTIPAELGKLSNLHTLYLWQNRLTGEIPAELTECTNLEAVDLSQNSITGSIPSRMFLLPKLNKLLLLDNEISGEISPAIGKCNSLIRFRANRNKIVGKIPAEIGWLKNLSFLDLGSNMLSGSIPSEITNCRNLTFLDLNSNAITDTLPYSLFEGLPLLQFLDLSNNLMTGELPPDLGFLTSLTKLILSRNRFYGQIPTEISSCNHLQLLDLSNNALTGTIPPSLGRIPSLEIALNLSWNNLSGELPIDLAGLSRLTILDLSHNRFSGDLRPLAALQNLVSVNISFNKFTGRIPNSSFFSNVPVADLTGNPDLCLADCVADAVGVGESRRAARIATAALLSAAVVLLGITILILLHRRRVAGIGSSGDDEKYSELAPPWEITLYQKLDITVADITKSLTITNAVGKGRSGIVYSATVPSTGTVIAVKKFRAGDDAGAAAEVAALARVRHRNIVRLLGWAANRRTRLFFYDFLPNGTLGEFLHGGGDSRGLPTATGWEVRLGIAVGVAEGLAYLHHDCVPAIIHRDVKADNVLLGDKYEACLADFGIACFSDETAGAGRGGGAASPSFAGSYGYIAPEYGYMMRITKKCDVFSFGVLLLEMITGRRPGGGNFGEGQTVAGWVRDHLRSKQDPANVIDRRLQGWPDAQEILQALGIALLCASHRPDDRPSMKDVAALLREIRRDSPAAKLPSNPANPHASSRSPSPPASSFPSLQSSITYSG